MYPEFPYVAFLAAFLVLFPLPWHWRSGNVATLSMIFWLFILNIIYGVDAIVWSDNTHIVIPVWCDITTRIIIAGTIALPAACMCVCMHLERVASVRLVRISVEDKRRRQMIEAALCFGMPCLWMILFYIVQGHRFDIIEGYGCRPATYVSIPAIFLLWVPPLVLALMTTVFAVLALSHFLRRRISFASHLQTRSGLTAGRYLRLMLLAIVEMCLTIGSTAAALSSAVLNIRPWISFSDVHFQFSRIGQFRAFELPQATLAMDYALWWLIPISAFLFFFFFAFGQDAVQEYGACFAWLRNHIFRLRVRESTQKGFNHFSSSANLMSSTTLPSTASTSYYPCPPTPASKAYDFYPKSVKDYDPTIPVTRTESAADSGVPSYHHSISPTTTTFSVTPISSHYVYPDPHSLLPPGDMV